MKWNMGSMTKKEKRAMSAFIHIQKAVDLLYRRLKTAIEQKNTQARSAWRHRKVLARAFKKIKHEADHSRKDLKLSIKRNYKQLLCHMKKAA